jgi:CHASE3 domain sensor protein
MNYVSQKDKIMEEMTISKKIILGFSVVIILVVMNTLMAYQLFERNHAFMNTALDESIAKLQSGSATNTDIIQSLTQLKAESDALAQHSKMMLIVLAMMSIIMGLAISFFIARSITNSIELMERLRE